MIVIGGITRLTQSGLSMVDWKLLMGIIPPLSEQQWLDSFNQYKQYPEYQKIDSEWAEKIPKHIDVKIVPIKINLYGFT